MFENFAKLFGIASGGSVTINGKTYHGTNVTVVNGVVTIDGKVQGGAIHGPISISVQGNVGSIETSAGDINVKGDCSGDIETSAGDIDVEGNCSGDIKTISGDVSVTGSVGGKINTVSGDINR
jgi:DUF4097 and DUF4098 domain-containing protein YvlB